MKLLILILLVPFFLFSQQSRDSIFNSIPKKPYSNIKIGKVTVTKTMYGLHFENRQISVEVKNVVKRFFKRRLNGYLKLKKYTLKIEKINNDYYIDDLRLL